MDVHRSGLRWEIVLTPEGLHACVEVIPMILEGFKVCVHRSRYGFQRPSNLLKDAGPAIVIIRNFVGNPLQVFVRIESHGFENRGFAGLIFDVGGWIALLSAPCFSRSARGCCMAFSPKASGSPTPQI